MSELEQVKLWRAAWTIIGLAAIITTFAAEGLSHLYWTYIVIGFAVVMHVWAWLMIRRRAGSGHTH